MEIRWVVTLRVGGGIGGNVFRTDWSLPVLDGPSREVQRQLKFVIPPQSSAAVHGLLDCPCEHMAYGIYD